MCKFNDIWHSEILVCMRGHSTINWRLVSGQYCAGSKSIVHFGPACMLITPPVCITLAPNQLNRANKGSLAGQPYFSSGKSEQGKAMKKYDY